MPTVDILGWTPTKYITNLLLKWSDSSGWAANGSLTKLQQSYTLTNFITQLLNTDGTGRA